MNSGRGGGKESFSSFSFFFCVPKRRNKKKAPQPVLALRASLASRRVRDAEKLGLRPQTVPASFPAPVCEARQDKWGNSHWHAAEHRKSCRKGRLHCLRRSRVCNIPAALRSAGTPARGGTRDTGGPFFGSFLWASKEMNRPISSANRPAARLNSENQPASVLNFSSR